MIEARPALDWLSKCPQMSPSNVARIVAHYILTLPRLNVPEQLPLSDWCHPQRATVSEIVRGADFHRISISLERINADRLLLRPQLDRE